MNIITGKKLRLLLLFGLALAVIALLPANLALAAPDTAVRVVSVEYYEEQIIVQNNGNTKIYFATEVDASKDNWEIIDADPGMYTMIDISWLSPTTENILIIKGDKNPEQSRLIISERPLKLEISINYVNLDMLAKNASIAPLVNIMTTVGNGLDPVTFDELEWRKGDYGQWTSTDSLTAGLLEKYLVRGTYLYFRIRAVDDVVSAAYDGIILDLNKERKQGIPGGIRKYQNPAYLVLGTNYPDGTGGRRFSNEVKLKIAKKSSPMVYGIDGERFTAEIKYGKEYRVTVGNGTASDWVQVTDRLTKLLPLTTILNNPAIDGTVEGKEFPDMFIEIRDYATSKAASSKITEISLDKQRILDPDLIVENKAPADAIALGDDNIYITYSGNKYLVVQIPTASPELPYEYCVIKKGDVFDSARAVWTSITKGTEVRILSSKAVEGGTIYIRQKEIQSKEATLTQPAVSYALASTYVTHLINYPSIPEIVDASYTFTKGYSGSITFNATLNAVGKKPFETDIKNIKLGTREIAFTTSTTTDASGVQTLVVTLRADSLASMTNCFNRYIIITYKNGTMDKSSVKLTIQNPVPATSLTVTPAKGTNTGTTAFTMVSAKGAGNTWVYVVGDTAITNVNTLDTIASKTALTPTVFTTTTVDNITAAVNQYLTIFEVDSTGHIVKYRCTQITAEMRS